MLFMASAVNAQDSVVGKSALDKAVQERVAQEQADRNAIASLLQRAEVRQVAARTGISLETAEAAVATLHGSDLEEIASQARSVENGLAGGASTVVISTTTIIIVLLLVLLIIAVAD
ncbi:MAG: PA2779 family protein [Acidobacteria bacterium]|nr:PA2779 family protein [Acidobacteriota bacterium]